MDDLNYFVFNIDRFIDVIIFVVDNMKKSKWNFFYCFFFWYVFGKVKLVGKCYKYSMIIEIKF